MTATLSQKAVDVLQEHGYAIPASALGPGVAPRAQISEGKQYIDLLITVAIIAGVLFVLAVFFSWR